MLDQVIQQGLQQLLTQGILGLVVLGLLAYIWFNRNEIKELREAHKIEIAAERKLNADLQERRLNDFKMLVDVSTSIKMGLEGVLTAIRAGK